MKVIGITGSIGTGKSLASRFFMEKGYTVLDADIINRELLKEEKVIKEINQAIFGIDSNVLDKNNLKKQIFEDDYKRYLLESLTHPLIRKKMEDYIDLSDEDMIFIDVPLLYEASYDEFCDYVIVMYASKKTQIERIKKRDHLEENEILKIINAQFPLHDKMIKADYVINNDLDKENTLKQLATWLERYRREFDGDL